MITFSVPAPHLPGRQKTVTPQKLPVVIAGEHVADARYEDDSYVFEIHTGDLKQSLQTGAIGARARWLDEPDPNAGTTRRAYTEIELVRNN